MRAGTYRRKTLPTHIAALLVFILFHTTSIRGEGWFHFVASVVEGNISADIHLCEKNTADMKFTLSRDFLEKSSFAFARMQVVYK